MTMTAEEYLEAITRVGVAGIRDRIDREDVARAEAEKFAARENDADLVQAIRDALDVGRTKSELQTIEFFLDDGQVVEAAERLAALKGAREYVIERIRNRFGVAGWKISRTGQGRKPGDNTARNVGMAHEYRYCLNTQSRSNEAARHSETAIKVEIGKDRGLGKTAAIAAVNDGLERLKKSSG